MKADVKHVFIAAAVAALCAASCVSAAADERPAEPVHVCVHDPSIFVDANGMNYVFGSHTAVASSEDLIGWKQLNLDYGNGKNVPFYGNLEETFAEPFKWAGFDDGDVSGNGYAVWAPDIIWNPYDRWRSPVRRRRRRSSSLRRSPAVSLRWREPTTWP